MQEIRTVVVAHIVEKVRLTVIERLCHTTVFRVIGTRYGKGLLEIGLSAKDIAVTQLGVAERDNLLDARLHLACNRRPVAALFILIVVCRLDCLRLKGLLNVLHRGKRALRGVHPRNTRLDTVLIAVVLPLGDIVAQIARVADGIIGRAVELAAVSLFHEPRLRIVKRVQIPLIALYGIIAADAYHSVTPYLPTMPVPLISLSSISSIDVSTREHAP